MKMFGCDADTSVTYRDAVIRVRKYHEQHPLSDSPYESGEWSGLVKALTIIFGNDADDFDKQMDVMLDLVRTYVPLP